MTELFAPSHLLYLLYGVVVGLTVGILPGLGGIAGLSLVLPFVFGMEPMDALAMMVGLTSVTSTSDTFPSVLMGVPGTAAAQATVVDGFPLAKQGQAARALSAAFTASLFGGVFGAVVLTGAVFAAKPIILSIGFGEQLMLVVLALTMVGMLTGESALKGLTACGIGLLIGAIGTAHVTGRMRMAFDSLYLTDGVPLVVVGLGIFAVPEIVDLLCRRTTISQTGGLGAGWMEGVRDAIRHWWIVLRCSGIGCLVGALPGLGGSVVDWIAYGHVAQTSRDRENFGKGDIRGVLAPESANNAKEGGALIPTLLFGIPGSGSMAVLLGGLILVGIEPGPNMVDEHLGLTFTVIWSIALANVFGTIFCIALAKPIALLTTIRYTLIAPFMLGIIFFAAFQASRDWGDLVALLAVGTLGVYMKRFGWSRPALLIGYVLSDKVEDAVYQTVQAYGFSFLERPIVIGLVLFVAFSIVMALRSKRRASIEGKPEHVPTRRTPQMIFWAILLLLPAWALIDAIGRPFSMTIYPITAAVATLVPLLLVGGRLAVQRGPHVLFYDSTHEADAAGGSRAELYLLWLIALLALSALIGFVFAVAAFIFVTLRWSARTSVAWSAIGAAVFVALLAALGKALVLEYPQGLLQVYMPMPGLFF